MSFLSHKRCEVCNKPLQIIGLLRRNGQANIFDDPARTYHLKCHMMYIKHRLEAHGLSFEEFITEYKFDNIPKPLNIKPLYLTVADTIEHQDNFIDMRQYPSSSTQTDEFYNPNLK